MKKLVSLVLAMMLLAAMSVAAVAETTELRVWLPPFGTEETLDKEFWDAQFDAFEAEHNVTIDVSIIADYGCNIPSVAWEIQENVRKEIKNMVDLDVAAVNIHVQGVEMK